MWCFVVACLFLRLFFSCVATTPRRNINKTGILCNIVILAGIVLIYFLYTFLKSVSLLPISLCLSLSLSSLIMIWILNYSINDPNNNNNSSQYSQY